MARKPKNTSETELAASAKPVATPEAVAPVEVEYRSRCGGALRTAREKAAMTVNDVAAQLRLSVKQIEALEADHFEALPEATIVKGFIRNYAKLLKLNPQPMLDAYNVIVPTQTPQSFTLQPSAKMAVNPYQKPDLMRYVALGGLLVVGLLIWLFYQSYVQKPSPVKPNADIMQPKVEEILPEAALPAGERAASYSTANSEAQTAGGVDAGTQTTPVTLPNQAETYTPAAPTAPPATATPAANPAPQPSPIATPATTPVPAPASVPIQTTLSETPQPIATAPVGSTKLEFNATQETWINVVDANGKEVYSKILFAGNREIISAKAPLNITVGNALGTTLNVNGKSVDLAPHTRVNVAHIKVD